MSQVTSRWVVSGTEAPGVLVLVCPHQAAATSSRDGCSSRSAFQLTGRAAPPLRACSPTSTLRLHLHPTGQDWSPCWRMLGNVDLTPVSTSPV